MPTYVFVCGKCDKQYETLLAFDPTGKYSKAKCPNCNSKKKKQQLTAANFMFAQPEGTDRHNNHHDYRFKHNIPKVQKEREMAQALSHMGANPYQDTSAEDIELDTGIHDAELRKGLS